MVISLQHDFGVHRRRDSGSTQGEDLLKAWRLSSSVDEAMRFEAGGIRDAGVPASVYFGGGPADVESGDVVGEHK